MRKPLLGVTSLALAALLCVGMVVPAFAQRSPQNDVLRLMKENRLAEQLQNLNLTAEQRQELKEILTTLREVQADTRTKLVQLLEERLEATLSGDAQAVDAVDKQIKALRGEVAERVGPALNAFKEGLTERQVHVLRSLIGPFDMLARVDLQALEQQLRTRLREIAPPSERREGRIAPERVIRPRASQEIRRDVMHDRALPVPGAGHSVRIQRALPALPGLPGRLPGAVTSARFGGHELPGQNIDLILSLLERME